MFLSDVFIYISNIINFSGFFGLGYVLVFSKITSEGGILTKTMANAGRDHAITNRHVEKDSLPNFCVPTMSGLASRSFGATYEVFFSTGLIK